MSDANRKRVLILGAGFGGLEAAKRLARLPVDVTVVDRQNHHLFQPLLYQVATAGLSAPEVAAPIRKVLGRYPNVRVVLDECVSVQLQQRQVTLKHSGLLDYDYLILAVGARTQYFGNDHYESFAPGLKSLDDATRIRHNVLLAFEEAERASDPEDIQRLTRIVVVGGGPTGVELAGAFAELSKRVLAKDFRNIDPHASQVILLEVGDRILGAFDPSLSEKAKRQLETLGVEVRLNQTIRNIEEECVELEGETIAAANILWGAGVAGSPLANTLGVKLDRANRIEVNPDLSVPDFPEVFAIGDLASLVDRNGIRVPGVSPAAMQMGRHAASLIADELKTGNVRQPTERTAFAYFDKGMMATIGRSRAVAQMGKLKFDGFLAWLAWLGVHLIFLIDFRNRIAVLLQWFYSYINYKRGARIITGMDRTFRIRNLKGNPRLRAERESQQKDPPSAMPVD